MVGGNPTDGVRGRPDGSVDEIRGIWCRQRNRLPCRRWRPSSPLAGALQNVASMPQFRPETSPGRVSVALGRDCSWDVKNGATGRRSDECGGPATKLAALLTGRPVSLVCRGELQSVSAVLIVGWIGGHQVFFRPFRETKASFGQVVHFEERALLQLEGYRFLGGWPPTACCLVVHVVYNSCP